MKEKSASQSGFFNLRVLIGAFVLLAGIFLALFAISAGERTQRGEVNASGLSFDSTTAGSAQIRRPERAVNAMSPWGGVQEAWVARYNGPLNAVDMSFALAVDG